MTVIASESASAALTILLFGPMQVLVNGRPIQPLRSRKALWLLALLTLRPGRSVDRAWLAGALWPDADQSRALTNLRVNLSELRHALGDQHERLQSSNRLTLSLDLAGADVDTAIFDAAIKSKSPEALRQAVAQYRGPLLEDCAEEWVGQERNVREQECLQALQTLGDVALVAGDHANAIDYYRRAVGLDRWREAARRGWMEALAKSGDRNAAMQVYREFVELLRSDPRAVPDEETSALYARLRAEASPRPGRQAAMPAAATGGNEAAAPIVSGYLPHSLTNLIGRKEECFTVAARLRGSRLVTLTGPGGIGKTRLALEIAREIVQDSSAYPNGVWLVALESLSEGRLVVPQIASVLGLREESGRSLLESLTNHLRTKRLLLVLDNCEHLVEACAQVSAHLLRECPRVRILATSREALRITGETVWQVPALAAPDVRQLPSGQQTLLQIVSGYESVQLFVERAQANQKYFALTASNMRSVAQVCSQLEGIPLAIEFAAARVTAMTVEQIASRLNDRLSLLTGGNRAAQPRQQTLRATLDWSYTLLSEPERLLLHRVSVFVGGWTLEAAEAVCTAIEAEANEIQKRDVLSILISLVDKSLVAFDERVGEIAGRYRLLETVRQYAVEHLEASGELEKIKTRHRDWFVALVEIAKLIEANPLQTLQRLEMEYNNLQAALVWCNADKGGAEAGLRLAGALGQFLYLRGYYSEGRKHLERALGHEEAQAATATRARALNGAGVLASSQGDYASAQTLLEESLRISQELADRSSIAVASNNLGIAYYYLGEFTAARALYEENLRLHRESGNRRSIALTLNNLGNVARNQGEYAAAQAFLAESLSLRKELGDRLGLAVVSNNLGDVALIQGESGLANALHNESLHINRELGDRQGIANSLGYLGNVARSQGEYTAAQAFYEESLKLYQQLGDRHGVANARNYLGGAAQDQGKYDEARTLYAESLSLYRELRSKSGIAYALVSLGDAVSRQGDYAAARSQLEEGLRLCTELGDKRGIAYVLSYLGRVVALQGDIVTARSQLEEGLRLCRESGDKRGIALTLENFAMVLSAQTESAQAARLLGAAQALRKSIRSPLPPGEQERGDRQIAQIRAALGTVAFTEAWEEGSTMTLEQAVDHALKDTPRAKPKHSSRNS